MLGKIIQLIPAPPGLYATYRMDDGNTFRCPIICYGLDSLGEVAALEAADWGGLDVCSSNSNFVGVEHG